MATPFEFAIVACPRILDFKRRKKRTMIHFETKCVYIIHHDVIIILDVALLGARLFFEEISF